MCLCLQEASEDEEDQKRTEEDEVFAEDYLLRVRPVLMTFVCMFLFACPHFLLPVQVCEAVQVRPGALEQLLQVFDCCSSSAERLYGGLSRVLHPWPQLLRDFAAFLNRGQARCCGLVRDVTLTSLHIAAPCRPSLFFCLFCS